MPWLTATILPGALLLDRSRLPMLGDFERCLAWAFIEEDSQS